MKRIVIEHLTIKFFIVLAVFAAVATISCYSVNAAEVGDKLGNVVHSDIKVYIDGVQINGYNIDGSIYISTRDLPPYGFKVDWDSFARSLSITRGKAEGNVNSIPKNPNPIGSVAFPYYYTDIDVRINGKIVGGYDIQQSVAILIDDFANEFGTIAWDGVKRELHASVMLPIESISLDTSSMTINRSDVKRIIPSIYPADATESVRYISNNDKIAAVSEAGIVRAVSAGTTVIKCISASGKVSASCIVNVVVPIENITISAARDKYQIGETCYFEVKVYPDDATDKTFTVSANGSDTILTDKSMIAFIEDGEVSITATASNGISESMTVTVISLDKYAEEAVRLTNIERRKNGLAEFSQYGALTAVASLRSQEIIEKFSHTRPDGNKCFTAYAEYGVVYNSAGENLSYGQGTPADAVKAWMNSPEHRANILNPKLNRIGIAVTMDSNGMLYWSQEFMD